MASTINAKNTSTGVVITPDSSGQLELQTADTTRMTIDVNGNVGIAATDMSTSGKNAKLAVVGNINLDDDNFIAWGGGTGRPTFSGNKSSNYMYWSTNGTERMRITSAGELWVARTTDAGAFNIQCGGTGVWGAGAYTNGSDARIKEEIAPLELGLDVVKKLNPVTYRYKEDWSKDQSIQPGFVAQDLLIALEDTNYKDGIVNQTGEYMSVAYQNIIPILTKAIQELKAELDTVKTELSALKGPSK